MSPRTRNTLSGIFVLLVMIAMLALAASIMASGSVIRFNCPTIPNEDCSPY